MNEAVPVRQRPPLAWQTLKLIAAVPMLVASVATLAGFWTLAPGPRAAMAFYFLLMGIEMWRWPEAATWFDSVSAHIIGPALTALFAAVFALSIYQFVTV